MRRLHAFMCLSSFLFLLFVFFPVFIAGGDHVFFGWGFLVKISLIAFLSAAAISLPLPIFKLRERRNVLPFLLRGALVFVILRGGALPSKAIGQLDGGNMKGLSPTPEALLILLGFLAAALFIGHAARKSMPLIAALSLLFGVTASYGRTAYLAHKYYPSGDKKSTLAEPVSPEFGPGFNVVALSMDSLAGAAVEKLLSAEPELFRDFAGFTVFSRGFSSFVNTMTSLPFIASGTLFIEGEDSIHEAYHQRMADSFLTDALAAGLDLLDINMAYGYKYFMKKVPPSRKYRSHDTSALNGEKGGDVSKRLYADSLAATFARLAGFWVPLSDISLAHTNNKINSLKFFDMMSSRLSAGGEAPLLLAAHNILLHPPIAFDRDGKLGLKQGAGAKDFLEECDFAMKLLGRMFEGMKKAGLYDRTLIVVYSDHGHQALASQDFCAGLPGLEEAYDPGGNFQPPSRYNTVLFIKPPRAAGSLKLDRSPVWFGYFRAILNFYIHNQSEMDPGAAVQRIVADEARRPEVAFRAADDKSISLDPPPYKYGFIPCESLEVMGERFRERTGRNMGAAAEGADD